MKEFGRKLLLPLLLIAALLIAVIPGAFAVEDAGLKTEETKAVFSVKSSKTGDLKPGDTFTLTVSSERADTNLAAFEMLLSYDPSQVTLVERKNIYDVPCIITTSQYLQTMGVSIVSKVNDDNNRKVLEVQAAYASGSGVRLNYADKFFEVDFKVNDNCKTASPDFSFTVKSCSSISVYGQQNPDALGYSTITSDLDNLAIKPTVDKISVSGTGLKNEYFVGDTLDLTNAQATVHYTDSTATDTFDLTTGDSGNCDLSTATAGDNKTLKVTFDGNQYNAYQYDGKNYTAFKYAVKKVELASIAVSIPPTKLTYIEEQEFESAGMVVTGTNNNGSPVSISVDDCTIDCDTTKTTSDTSETKQVTVTYHDASTNKDFSDTFDITVNAKKVTKIEWIEGKTPTKKAYIAGKDMELDVDGGQYKVYFDNGKDETVDLTVGQCSDFDPVTLDGGTNTITVTYDGAEYEAGVKPLTYTITWAKEASEIKITKSAKDKFVQTDEFVADGEFKVKYTDSSYSEAIAMADEVNYCSSPDMNTVGKKTVTITYQELTAEYTIQVLQKVVTDAKFSAPTAAQEYLEGTATELDLTDGRWQLTYNGGNPSSGEKTLEEANTTFYKKVGETESKFTENDLKTPGTYQVVAKATFDGNQYTGNAFTVTVTKKKPTEIVIDDSNKPTMSFKEGTDFKWTSGQVVVKYDNNTSTSFELSEAEVVTTATDRDGLTVNIGSFNKDDPKTYPITISYKENGATVTLDDNVTVVAKVLEKIEVTTSPKTEYYVGDAFEITGGVITLSYDNDTTDTKNLTDEGVSVSTPDMTTDGTKTITVAYGGKTATYTINVKKVELESIAVTTLPTKREYIEEQQFESTGMVVTGTKNNGDQVQISVDDCTIDWSTIKTTTATSETKQVTVKYTDSATGKTFSAAPFDITVKAKSVKDLEWVSYPKRTYIAGEDRTLSVENGKFKVNYDNDTSKEVTLTADMCSPFVVRTTKQTNPDTMTVNYGGKTLTYDITWDKRAKSIAIVEDSITKTSFVQTQSFEVDGQIKVVYSDDTEDAAVDITIGMCSGYDMSQDGDQTVKITYQDFSATYTIHVLKKVVTNALFSAPTAAQEYLEGTATKLNLTGGKWELTYNGGNPSGGEKTLEEANTTFYKTVGGTESKFTENDLKTPGTYQVIAKATFDGNQYTGNAFTVTVNKKTPTAIAIDSANQPKTSFKEESAFTSTIGKVIVTYDNGTKAIKNLSDVTVDSSLYDKNTPGTYIIYVSYTENGETKETSYNVTVVAKQVVSIAVKDLPKTAYKQGALKLELGGGTIKVNYDNDRTDEVSMETPGVSVTGYNLNKVAIQTLTVTYGGKKTTFTISVNVVETETKVKEAPHIDDATENKIPNITDSKMICDQTVQNHTETKVASVVTSKDIKKGLDQLNEGRSTELSDSNVIQKIETTFQFKDAVVTKKDGKTVKFTVEIVPVTKVILCEKDNETNCVTLKDNLELDFTGEPVVMTIALPDDFSSVGGFAYIQHGKVEFETLVQYNTDTGKNEATITNTGGFSPFTVSDASEAEAKVDGVRYMNLQDAVDAVKDGGTITLFESCRGKTAIVKEAKTFTMTPAELANTVHLEAAKGLKLAQSPDGTVLVVKDTSSPDTGINSDGNIGAVIGILALAACLSALYVLRKRSVK